MIIRSLKTNEEHSKCCYAGCQFGAVAMLEYDVKYPITHLPTKCVVEAVCIEHAKETLDLWEAGYNQQ